LFSPAGKESIDFGLAFLWVREAKGPTSKTSFITDGPGFIMEAHEECLFKNKQVGKSMSESYVYK
jgi:hypothetical protein